MSNNLTERIAALSPEQRALLARQLASVKKSVPEQSRITSQPRESQYVPLSFAQERIWFLEQLVPGNLVYTITQVARVVAPMSVTILNRCFQEIVRRHETLRMTFTTVDGQPMGIIGNPQPLALQLIDLREGTMAERETKGRQLIAQGVRQPFALDHGPLLRIMFLQLADQEYLIVLNMHHIISDGWSARVLFQEIGELYWAFAAGKSSPLPDLAFQYADFAQWQKNWLQNENLDSLLGYWKKQLAGRPLRLELPADRPRAARQSYQGTRRPLSLTPEVVQALKVLGQRQGATLAMLLLAAFKTLLYRYTGQSDLLVGMPIANRTRPGMEALIGFFVNTLVIRTDFSSDPSFLELLEQVRSVTLAAYEHQDLPFEKLVEELQPERDLSYSPLFQVLFNYKRDAIETARIPVLQLDDVDNGTAQFDLTLNLVESGPSIDGYINYNTDLFYADTIERIIAQYEVLLQGIIVNPQQRVSQLPLLTEGEQQKLRTWNMTQEEYPSSTCIHHLIAAQAILTPERVAATCGNQSITYRELNQKANWLACFLQTSGVGPETFVGICMERSLDMIVGLLGILKAGGAYVPLDPSYPPERLTFMQQDAGIPILLIQQRLLDRVPICVPRVVCIDTDWEYIAAEANGEVASDVTASNAAYVIYTSGSTGIPKGVIIQHRSVVNLLHFMCKALEVTSDDTWLAVTTLSFDIAALELFLPLIASAQLVVASSEVTTDGVRLAEYVSAATIMQATPATWRMLLEAGWHGHTQLKILCGGEVLSDKLAHQLLKCGTSLWNVYGPTETTIWSTIEHIEYGHDSVSIGRPVANTQVYLWDSALQSVPVGVPGELYIGGDGLARGYHQRAELTAEKFIRSPFDAATRLYRTGDLARFLPDGRIEFLGRIDHQVKLRGFRIELGEIEAALRGHPAVEETVVVVHEDTPDEKRLVAYLVLALEEQLPSPADFRLFLQSKLPEYMFPAIYVQLDALPQTPNGKVDRKALPAPRQVQLVNEHTFVAPRTETERVLASLWEQVLGVSPIGVDDSFFDLGGHSLLATRLVFSVREALHIGVPLQAFFQSPTIAALAQTVELIREKGPAAVAALNASFDLAAEAVLDPAIRPQITMPVKSVADAQRLFMTGATGFVGVFLLSELLHQTDADIYCLVRALDEETGKKRIQRSMDEYGVWDERFSSRIIAVPGDLAQPKLGLRHEEFERLANTVEVIYHNGAAVNFMYPYPAVKPTNVRGTEEVLRLACHGPVKPVHFISTIYVFSRAEYAPGDMLREEDQPRHSLMYTLGYTQSKWVAEQLVMEAGVRGLPVSIYRLGRVAGHSQSGVCQVNDFVWQAIQVGIRIAAAPDIDMLLDMTPIDYVSKALVHISRQEKALGKHFHIVNEQSIHSKDLIEWMRSFGYDGQLIPFDRWCTLVRELAERSPESTASVLAPILTGVLPIDELAEVYFDDHNTVEFLREAAITCPPVDSQLLTTYFSYFVQSGYFEPPVGRKAQALQ